MNYYSIPCDSENTVMFLGTWNSLYPQMMKTFLDTVAKLFSGSYSDAAQPGV